MNSFIKQVPNLLSEDYCNDFLQKFESLNLTPEKNHYNFNGVRQEYRHFCRYDELELLDRHICKIVDKEVQEYVKSCGISYREKSKLDGSGIVKLAKNIPLELHYDPEIISNNSKLRRHFTVLLYLHPCKGGELYFPQQKEIVVPEAGKLIIFPAYWTHPHTVFPCTDRDRYTYMFNYILEE